jgi:hypothetical protein
MIADAFLSLITALINALYSALPSFDASSVTGQVSGDPNTYSNFLGGGGGGMSSLQAVMSDVWEMNVFFPVDHMIAIITLGLTIWGCIAALNLARWLIGTVRGSGTGTGAPA